MRLETNRLCIRRLQESDWRDMKAIFADFSQSPYAVYDRPFPTDDDAIKDLTKHFASSGLFFAVFEKDARAMIGYVCFHRDGDAFDLGYCFHSAFHAKGYAFESTQALMDHIVTAYGATRFTAGTALNNTPSCRLLEKLGFACFSTETVSFEDHISFEGGNFVRDVKPIP